MPKKVLDEDQLRRKQALQEKRAARKKAKEAEEKAAAAKQQLSEEATDASTKDNASQSSLQQEKEKDKTCHLVALPVDAARVVFSMLSAAELGRVILTCKSLNQVLSEARTSYLLSRLSSCRSQPDNNNVYSNKIGMIQDELQAYQLLKDSYGGGDTGRLIARGSTKKHNTLLHNEFVSYARFIEQAVCGYGHLVIKQDAHQPIPLSTFSQGRFCSVSPEHSLVRLGFGESTLSTKKNQTQPPPLSGVASWGVGKRGQLGHDKRQDVRNPQRLRLQDLPVPKIRIVQVSAGGGLVRVAHSLLLTDTGRIFSFGTGQYGAFGHGYSAAKQLPDQLTPRLIQGLQSVLVTHVAAGELHSAVVTSDGDVYSWGDGFCGQLGHGDKRPQLTPKQVEQGGLEDECVANITCGSRHTLAVTEDGEVWSWGLGHFGVLGRGYTPFDYDADTAVEAFTGGPAGGGGVGEPVDDRGEAAVAAAANVGDDEGDVAAPVPPAAAAAAVVAAEEPPVGAVGAVGAVGDAVEQDGVYGTAELMAHLDLIANLTLDDSSTQCIPMPIESLKGIRMVGTSAGHRHSLFLDAQGGLYSSGAGSTGCLGHGDTLSQMHPVKIMALQDEGVAVLQMSAGVDMSMAVSTTGDVYAWGKTAGGRIGLDPVSTRGIVMQPRRITLSRRKNSSAGTGSSDGNEDSKVGARQPIKAVDVECGYVHSIIVGLDGTYHMCGSVGIEGEADGQVVVQQQLQEQGVETQATGEDDEQIQKQEQSQQQLYQPRLIPDINIWHRLPEPQDPTKVKGERWKKFAKYEVKGRSKMMSGDTN